MPSWTMQFQSDRSIDPSCAVAPDSKKLHDRSCNVYGDQTCRLHLFPMPARYQNFSLAFFWHNVWVKFRFTLHGEYVSMGIYLDLSGADRLEEFMPLKMAGTDDTDLTLQTRIPKHSTQYAKSAA
jgi:hypothetical protein